MAKGFCRPMWVVLFLLSLPPGCGGDGDSGDSSAPPSEAPARGPVDLIPFAESSERGDLYGYRDANGRVVVEPRFLMADEFSDGGLAAVVDESGWAYIDKTGQVVVRPFVFDNGPDPFSEGLARFEREGRFGFFDQRGKVVIEPRFDFARPFSEGLAAVCQGCARKMDGEHWSVSGGAWGYVNTAGEQAIPLVFDEAAPFEEGRASVVQAGVSKTIGKDGRPLP